MRDVLEIKDSGVIEVLTREDDIVQVTGMCITVLGQKNTLITGKHLRD